MRLCASIITAATLLLHLFMGCQWHHAHAAQESGHEHHSAHDEVHHDDESTSPASQLPTPEEPCDEGECVYVVTGTSYSASPLAVAIAFHASSADLTLHDQGWLAKVVDLPRVSAAVRPHLLFQVILI